MRKTLFLLALIAPIALANAQTKTHLPYSIFGIGELNPKGYSRNLGMGKTGIATSSALYLNNINPASLHDIDSISFFFDFGLSGNLVTYRNANNKQSGRDVNFNNLAMGFKIARNWAASVGITPFSTVAYKIDALKNVEGSTDSYAAELTGTGGLSQFYLDQSYVLFKHLSLGMHAAYIFGNVESNETVTYSLFPYTISSDMTSRLDKVILDFGFQYFIPVKDKYRISVGGVFGNDHSLKFKQSVLVSQSDGTVFKDEITRKGNFTLPMYYGGGVAFEWRRKLAFAADYQYNDWSRVNSGSTEYRYTSTHSYRAGVEVIPGAQNQFGYLGRMSYRLGFYHEGSYIQLNNTTIPDNGISIGVGIPFVRTKTSVNLSYCTGVRGTVKNGLIRENYHSFLLSLTLHDWWFVKTKYD
jgi:hypothetical protein